MLLQPNKGIIAQPCIVLLSVPGVVALNKVQIYKRPCTREYTGNAW